MSPRIKVRAAVTPLVMAGAMWATSALTPVALGGGAQTPPPCGPDGVCVPRPQTYGWYQTRWRTFPGDVAFKPPTPAPGAEGPQPESLGGPQLPTPAEEGLLGPARQQRPGPAADGAPGAEGAEGGEAPPEDAAGAGLGVLPGEAPLSGFELPGATTPPPGGAQPPAEGAEGAQPGGVPDTGPLPGPGAEPGAADPLDPFGGNAPPAPPSWISRSAIPSVATGPSVAATLPVVEHLAAPVGFDPSVDAPPAGQVNQSIFVPTAIDNIENAEAAPVLPPLDGPNVHSDDAPPVLPPTLLGGIAGARPAAGAPAANAQPVVRQPASVQPITDGRVTAASAESPLGIQLINPAAALVDPAAEGLHQAIYFEASDQ